jgi:hypothetical protein
MRMKPSGQAAEFRYSSRFNPLDHKDVTLVIEARAVRANEPAGRVG